MTAYSSTHSSIYLLPFYPFIRHLLLSRPSIYPPFTPCFSSSRSHPSLRLSAPQRALHPTVLSSPTTPLPSSNPSLQRFILLSPSYPDLPPSQLPLLSLSPGVPDSPPCPSSPLQQIIPPYREEQTKGSSAANASHFHLSICVLFVFLPPPSNISLHLCPVCLFAGGVFLPWRPDLAVWHQRAAAARSGLR